MIYLYECRECGQQYNSRIQGNWAVTANGDDLYCCHLLVKRKYQLAVHRPMLDHFNNTTGTVIGSDRQFREELKAMSEVATNKTGIEHDYQPIDPEIPRKVVEQSDARGLESTNRVRVASGGKPIDI